MIAPAAANANIESAKMIGAAAPRIHSVTRDIYKPDLR